MDLNMLRNEIKDAERKLMPQERLKRLKEIQGQANSYWKGRQSTRDSEIQAVDERVAWVKPKNGLELTEEERRQNPEIVAHGNRKLDSKNVAVLNYLSKLIMSKVAAEGDSPEKFVRVVEEFANHEDINIRYAFLDNYHDVLSFGKSLEGFDKVSYDLKQQYLKASDSVKTPEQLKYEEFVNEADNEKRQIMMKYLPEEKNVSEFMNDLNIRVEFLRNEVNGTAQEKKGVWS